MKRESGLSIDCRVSIEITCLNNQVNNKRIAKNTLFLYFRTILVMLIALYTSRVVLNVLGVEGLWRI